MSTHLLSSADSTADFTHQDFRDLIARLIRIQPDANQVLSCYLQLGPVERESGAHRLWVKQRCNALVDGLPSTMARAVRLEIERDLERITEWAAMADLPHSRGVAIFACEALSLFSVVPIPAVLRNRLILDDTPWIRELLAAERASAPVTVVLLDRKHARFLSVTPWAMEELGELDSRVTPAGKFHGDRADAPGWGERAYHHRIEQEHLRHYALVTHRLEELQQVMGHRSIVVAGPHELVPAFLRFLPPQLRRSVIGTSRINPTAAGRQEIHAAALTAAVEDQQLKTRETVAELREALGTGWGVSGVRETLQALNRGQVRHLLFHSGQTGSGFRCGSTGALVLTSMECGADTERNPVQDLTDEVVEEALRQAIAITEITDPALLDAIDGYAAILRFR